MKKLKYLFVIFAILTISMSASGAKADDNEGEGRGGHENFSPSIVKQIQGLDFSNMFRGQDKENEDEDRADQPASLIINPNGNARLNGANVVAAPSAGATSLQVKAWGLTFNLVLNSATDLRARGGTIALTDIHANDDVNVQGNMDVATGNIIVSRLEDITIASHAQDDQVRNQISVLIARLNELLSRAGLPPIPTPTPASTPTSTPVAVVPTLSSLSPASTTFGGGAFTLTLNGMNFVSNSVANWAGTALTTTFISATQLTAMVPAASIATTTTAMVSVTNPGTTGGTSNSLNFIVR